ncbi:MAG: EamA family transporter [Acidobacteria bacterium]|nr:EamA family transporter [Acidobacteriota bacterium]
MPVAALLLVLLSGLLHATWNLAAKRAAAGADFVILYSGLTCIVYAPAAIWYWPSLPAHIGWQGWGLVALSGMLHVVYGLVLQRGYQVADLSVVYPVARGTGPMLSSLAAVLILGEHVTWASVSGLLLVVLGILGLSRPNGRASAEPGARQRGILYGLATGVCIALYTVVDATSVRVVRMPPLLLDYLSNATRTLLLLPVVLHRGRHMVDAARRHGRAALVVAVLAPMAYILVLQAMQSAPVTRVAPTREVSMLFAVLLGAAVLGERQGFSRLVSAASIATGVITLSLGR